MPLGRLAHFALSNVTAGIAPTLRAVKRRILPQVLGLLLTSVILSRVHFVQLKSLSLPIAFPNVRLDPWETTVATLVQKVTRPPPFQSVDRISSGTPLLCAVK